MNKSENWRIVVEVESSNLGTVRREVDGMKAAKLIFALDSGRGAGKWVKTVAHEIERELNERYRNT